MSDEETKSIGVSSCISGDFEPIADDTSVGNKWSFSYNKSQNNITMGVNINTPAMLLDMTAQSLKSELLLDDINQLLHWLFQVKVVIQQQNPAKKLSSPKSEEPATKS